MTDKREEIPYDEDGKLLSFSTDAETVYVDGVPLKTWLKNLEEKLTKAAIGKDGNSFYDFLTEYTAVSEVNNNLEAVKNVMFWESNSPALTPEKPHLWKRVQSRAKDYLGKIFVTNIDYLYCGSLGSVGQDAEWKEWIFRILDNKGKETDTAFTLQAELDTYYSSDKTSAFLLNDFIPPSWDDDMKTVTDELSVQWCASRYKKDGLWSKFSNVHVFGRKPLDAVTSNNIYAVTPEIIETSWNQDRLKLIESLVLDRNSGKVSNFPAGTKYNWVDFVPNTEAAEIVYQATAYFLGSTCVNVDAPVRITGPAGAGSDGNGVEFAYCVSDSEKVSNGLPPFYASEKHFESLGGWFDKAVECPISLTHPYQFMRLRFGLYTNANDWFWEFQGKKYGKSPNSDPNILDPSLAPSGWNYGWSEPMLWSSWGVDGIDGDGVQYVYVRLTEEEFLFVNADPSRWNFDGGFSGSGSGEGGSDDPSNPGDSLNYKYTYYLIPDTLTARDIVPYDTESLTFFNVTGKYTIHDASGKTIQGLTDFTISVLNIKVSLDDINLSLVTTKDCTQSFTYSGEDLPGNKNGSGSVSGTVNFTRGKCPQDSYDYSIYFLDIDTYSEIKTHEEYTSLIAQEHEIIAPSIPGYKIADGTKTKDTVKYPRPLTITFYYKKL